MSVQQARPQVSRKRNALWNLAGSALPMLAGGLDSVHVDRLGSEMFGALTLIWGLIGYFSLFVLVWDGR